jgi:hypothetical protein
MPGRSGLPGCDDVQRLIEAERQDGFDRDANGATLGEDLGERSSTSTGAGPNCCTFAAAGDGSNDGTEHSTSAGILSGSLVRAET